MRIHRRRHALERLLQVRADLVLERIISQSFKVGRELMNQLPLHPASRYADQHCVGPSRRRIAASLRSVAGGFELRLQLSPDTYFGLAELATELIDTPTHPAQVHLPLAEFVEQLFHIGNRSRRR